MLVTKFSRCILQTNTATQTLITNHASLTKMLAKSMLKKPQKGTLNEYHKYPHFSKIRVASLQFDKKTPEFTNRKKSQGDFQFQETSEDSIQGLFVSHPAITEAAWTTTARGACQAPSRRTILSISASSLHSFELRRWTSEHQGLYLDLFG